MKWMHSCKRVAELLSQRLDAPLGLIDEMMLRVHLSMCGNCRHVEQQLNGVHAATADLFSADQELDDDAEAAAARERKPPTPDRGR